ncbi:MAG: putative toxin-antitoxin system toxin component, PIN family [Vicinamibacterales bacterium]
MTVVLDTNVLVAALVAKGLCLEVVQRTIRMRCLVSSSALLDELESTLRLKFEVTPVVARFLALLREQTMLVDPFVLPEPVCRDPDDDIVLGTAMAAGAEVIVTGDKDLLVLGVYEGIRIETPRQFLEGLDEPSRE